MSGTGIFGNVGIGTTTPGPNLEIFDSNAGARSTYFANTHLGLQRDGQALINSIGGATSLSSRFGDSGVTSQGRVRYDNNTDQLTFGVGGLSNRLSFRRAMSTRETKQDITPPSLDDLAIVNALKPVSFTYKKRGRTRYGFIAEDAAAVDAHLATYNASGR